MGGLALGPQSVGSPLSGPESSSYGTSQKGEAQTWPPTPASPCAVLNGRHLQPNRIDRREQGTHRR
jgi:hypothetical protein